ncbi:MAG: methyltransferase/methylesterase, CheR/CheB with sensor [Bryobacterales bacterium]|nr:methyltransferase/methylesterase, CheR/CheB with sensor [Bryobacterales bacterium]
MPRKKTLAAPKRSRAAPGQAIQDRKTFPIVGVGASAGGLEAFRSLLQTLPHNTGMAFVFVQHLDPEHESLLTKLLSHATRMPVTEVTQGVAVRPDHIYVIPPNTALGIRHGILHLQARKKQDGRHMPIDHFFQSLAENEGSRAIGVILSGVATDGTLGLTAIKAAGGITFAQDARSAKYDGMPRSAIGAGCVDFVFSPEGIGRELKRIGLHPYLATPDHPDVGDRPPYREEGLRTIFALLRNASGVDFTHYKRSTINRRIARRMVLHKVSNLRQYIKHLGENRAELTALYEDILIHVTGFFREPDTFRALKETILPRIFRTKERGEPLRIWVAGCSTGEEVYSIAITVLEYLRGQAGSTQIQIFATDVSDTALERARAGIYSESVMSGVSRERMRQFFVRADGGYQITKSVREMCIFARQDLAKDPPYSRLDLLTCRNVLIYMEPVLQKKVMTIFHYALKPTGFLVLGKSESISGFSELFTPVGRKRKIYSKKSSSNRPGVDLPAAHPKHVTAEPSDRQDVPARFDVQKEADRIIMNHYAPAGLVASDDLQILHFRGNVAPYLSPSPGQASLSLLRMVRPEFGVELRTAIHRAGKQEVPIRKAGVLIKRNGRLKEVSLEVLPLKGSAGERFFLVLFHETRVPASEASETPASKTKSTRAGDLEETRLQRELQTTKEHLQSIIEEHEAINEELKSANEEVLSSNEELQSTNEELETAQEELQSSNEELVTINEQLQNRNQELSQLSDDWSNLLGGLNIPIVMLGNDRRIRRFTSPAEKLLNLLPSDIGRPIGNIRPNLKVPDLDGLITDVIDKVSQREIEIQDRDERWYSMRLRPYRTADNRIDGVLMIFVDVHAVKTTQDALRDQNSFSTAVMESSGALVMVTDTEGRVVAFNRACQIASGYKLEEMAGKVIWDRSLVPKEEIDRERTIYRRLVAGRAPIQHEGHWIGKKGSRRLISWNSAAIPLATGRPRHLVRIGTDITERREIETALQKSEAALRQSQAQLQALTAGLLSAQEEERARVARELHDDISQKLAMLNLEAESVLRKQPQSDGKLRTELTRLSHRLRGILRDVERTAYRLHPSSLDHLGLSVALKSYCTDFSTQNGIALRCTDRNLPRGIQPTLALTIYRVVQEALRNVVKHSGARRAMISVAGKNGAINLTVRDFGRGFDVSRSKKRGLGLISMEERVRQAGGVFTLKTTPGKGVRIDVILPIPSRKAQSSQLTLAHAK